MLLWMPVRKSTKLTSVILQGQNVCYTINRLNTEG